MAILGHVEATAAERQAYVKQASALRRTEGAEDVETVAVEEDAEDMTDGEVALSPEKFAEMQAKEQFVLTISEKGFGKRSSSYEFRTSGRGGKGIVAMVVNDRNGPLVASFPVEHSDQIMLVTDGGQLIRCPVDGIRKAGRSTQGVIVIDTADDENVVSVERLSEDEVAEGEA